MNKLRIAVSVLLVLSFVISGSLGASAIEYGSYFDSMLQFMRGMYYKDIIDEEGLKAALKGMFSGLDKYSAFYDNKEAQAVNDSLNGNFVGIGVLMEKSDAYFKIVKVFDGSPAEKAGVQDGDVITAVDGKSMKNLALESVTSVVQGEEGTSVKLTVLRGNSEKVFTIVRGTVKENPVQLRIEGKTAYIRIDGFITGAGEKFREAMVQVKKNKIYNIILDLRGNTGGYVNEAVDVAKELIPPGVITTLDYKSEEIGDRVFTSEAKNPDYVVAILVDENTASASEILAGALEDAGNGIIIGQKTFGKGVFQSFFTILAPAAYEKYSMEYGDRLVTEVQWKSYYDITPEPDEILGTVKLTTGYYLTPKGRVIDGIGLVPVVKVPNRAFPNDVDLSKVGSVNNTATMTIDLYSSEVYNAESVLKAAGYLSAAPDRKYDVATVDAVKKYQQKVKLPVTGLIDAATRNEINKTLNELRRKNDLQYTKACEILSWFSN